MKRVACLFLCAATAASAQDSSFSVIRVRAAALRLPEVGRLAEDWRPRTGAQLDVASTVGRSEVAFSVGHVAFDALTGKPPFGETLISLAWTTPIAGWRAVGLDAGARLTDVRMDFDDPALVGGLRNEEEQLLSVLARGRLRAGRNYSAFVEVAYGALMTSTRSPTAALAVGLQREGAMPNWLRAFLR
jgi:hypothetical protein